MKKRKSCFIWLLCILLLVTALPAVDFTDVQAASVSSTFTGWKTFGGKKYYYKNGKKLTDLHKIGKYYYCFAADGTMLTGWHRIHNRFRYFGKHPGFRKYLSLSAGWNQAQEVHNHRQRQQNAPDPVQQQESRHLYC